MKTTIKNKRSGKKDEYAIVLDYLPRGYAASKSHSPIVQAIATNTLNLLELIPKSNVNIVIGEKVYIGSGTRDKIETINKRIYYKQLTSISKNELENAVNKIVEENEERYVNFYNTAESLTIREHQLSLLPGMGKKTLWQILEERKKGPFESFEDIKKRIPNIPDPKKMIVKRILEEIEKEQKVYLFTQPPAKQQQKRFL